MRLIYLLFMCWILLLSACVDDNNSQGYTITSEYSLDVNEPTHEKSATLKQILTTQPLVALTFNGLPSEEITMKLLDELDRLQLKATFFLPGMRVAEEPHLALAIKNRGHDIQNNTLNHLLMTDMSYEDTYYEIQLTNEIIEKELGITPTFVRSRSGDTTEEMQQVAHQLGMEAVVSFNIQPAQLDALSISNILHKSLTRGDILSFNPYRAEEVIDVLQQITEIVNEKNLQLTTLSNLYKSGYTIKPIQTFQLQYPLQMNLDYEEVIPNVYYRNEDAPQEVALTFDDWANETQLLKVLDVLDYYNIQCSFFLIGEGVERKPMLAKLIVERGHEVANHSYHHLDVTTMSPEDLQKDILKAHEVITEAIQQEPLPFFRTPTGTLNEQSAKVIAATGIRTIVQYDVTSYDWDLSNSAMDIYENVIQNTQPGSVIVMHILDNTNTPEALPLIIEKLQADGYTFVKVSDWITPTNIEK